MLIAGNLREMINVDPLGGEGSMALGVITVTSYRSLTEDDRNRVV